jgi:hypothetical protein
MSRKLRIEYPGDASYRELSGSARGYMKSKWIVQQLQMGTWTYVSNLLNEPLASQPQTQEVLPFCR